MKKRRPLIGVVIKDADHDFWSRSLSRLQKEFFAADMDVAVFSAFKSKDQLEDAENEHAIFQLVQPEALDGLVVYLDRFQDQKEKKRIQETVLKDFDKPVVYIRDGVVGEDAVAFDNTDGANALMEHLAVTHGVRTAVYISGPENSSFHQAIEQCFAAAMERQGVARNKKVYYTNDWVYDYESIAREIISAGLPDAVVCCSEMTAASMIKELSHRGVRIPEQLIVTGYRYNEPRVANHYNITSVLRLPDRMAINAARKLISRIEGVEMDPVDMPTFELKPGLTCGCQGVDLEALSQSAFDDILLYRSIGFNSRHNYMPEELVGSQDIEDYFRMLSKYTSYLGNVQGVWMCLNENVLHARKTSSRYSAKMNLCYTYKAGAMSVDFQRKFPRKKLLPEIYASREKPSAFLFNAFHFSGKNYGYIVLSYGDSGDIYDENYVRWLRHAASGIESKRQQILFQDEVEDMRTRDNLTGLLNMRGYIAQMTHMWNIYQDQGYMLRVIALSIENLNGIRDAYGYQAADTMVQKFANLLTSSMGTHDICARQSSEVFFIAGLLNGDDPVDEVPLRLQQNLDAFNANSAAGYGLTVCSATLSAPFDSEDVVQGLPAEADFQRKLNRENNRMTFARRVRPEDEAFDEDERNYVAHMLDENLFTYHFQPIVEASTGVIIAYEALMRSGTDRAITPYAILQHAKALGRLREVERLTITNLLAYLRTHTRYFRKKKLFINSIPSCILSTEEFAALKEQYGDLMDQITIEFTEQSEASTEQLRTLLNLREDMGFYLAIDDYGTGYSNISNLLTLMPNYIKIDRSLISNIHEDRRKKHFAQNIIDYAHDNEFKVLAEGVEQTEELKTVIRMGVDLIQGFYTGRPEPKPVATIGEELMGEISEVYQSSQNKQVRRVYYTGSEKEILLHTLDFNDYTEICINSSEYTIRGKSNFSSTVTIRIKDGLRCKLTLDNVSLKSQYEPVCMELGEDSKLELNIVGDVTLTGGIRVPATAELTMVGDGQFSMFAAANQTFGIGNDHEHSYGNINLHMTSRLFFQLDALNCVVIGGGHNDNNSCISVDGCQVDINMAGREIMGLGCREGHADIRLNSGGLSILHNCRKCIAVGGESYHVAINSTNLRMECHGDVVAGVFGYGSQESTFEAENSTINIVMRGKMIHGIGTHDSFMHCSARKCGVDINCNGVEAYALGNAAQQGNVNLYDCRGTITIESGSGYALGVPEANTSLELCQLTVR